MIEEVTPEQLKALLKEHKITQASAAALCKVSSKTMERWCQGVNKVTPITYYGVKSILELNGNNSISDSDQS